MKSKINFNLLLLGGAAMVAFILLSPKWLFAPGAWFAPALLLAMMYRLPFWKALFWGWLVLVLSGLVGGYGVLPFPSVFFILMMLFLNLLKIVPFALSRWLYPRIMNKSYSLFIFPLALVTIEYLDSFGGGGTWGSLAYTQFGNEFLIQSASLVGIWGITFLIGWFASLLVWSKDHSFQWTVIKKPVIVFASVLFAVLLFGMTRMNPYSQAETEVVRIAGITANNAALVKSMYEDYFGKKVDVDPDALTQSSPELQELQKGFVKFIENPGDSRFQNTHRKITSFQDSLFSIAAREADAGAKLIAFSEGLLITPKEDEDTLILKGVELAKAHDVYVVLSMASLISGKVELGSKFLENKVLLISPSGEVETTFFKNKPVPVVEPSIPGNGEVPVIQTPFGRVALSICYDADFPSLIRKAGQQQADILVLPSGDWKEISPYHAHMAAFRATENGFSLVRIVSGATSIATDGFGKVIASRGFYDRSDRVLVGYVPTKRLRTLYVIVGDSFAWVCAGGLLMFWFLMVRLKRLNEV